MPNIFKAAADTGTFNDSDLKKMSSLWQGNEGLSELAVKEKWRTAMGDEDAIVFVKKLRQTVVLYKEHIKKLYKIDPDEREDFEKAMVNTIVALESVFTLN